MRWSVERVSERARRAVSVGVVAVWAAAQLGCSGSGTPGFEDGGAADSGSDRPAITLTPASAIFEHTGDFLRVVVTDVVGACAYTQRNEVKAGARGVIITVLSRSISAGTYTVNTMSSMMPVTQASYGANDDACRPVFATPPYARDGSTLVIRSISPDRVDGSYALDFGAGRMLSGEFQAVNCAPLSRLNPACVP